MMLDMLDVKLGQSLTYFSLIYTTLSFPCQVVFLTPKKRDLTNQNKGFILVKDMDKLSSATGGFASFVQHVTDQIAAAITSLAATAGLLLQHLWEILTRQQIILGLQQLLVGIAMIVGSIISYKLFRKFWQKKGMNNVDKYFTMAIFFVIALWLVVHGLQYSIDSLPRLLNPEYYALQESVKILQQVKP